MQNSPSTQLYNLLVTRDYNPEALDANGRSVSDPETAVMFSFDWRAGSTDYESVVALISPDQALQVYYGSNLSGELQGQDRAEWYSFLRQLKSFAVRNMLSFDLRDLSKLKHTLKSFSNIVTEGTDASKYYGNRKTSYSNQPKQTRLVINHSKQLGEGEARYRYIDSLYIESNQGERFRLPFTKLVGGKAMARHVAEGGTPYDDFGKHICQIVDEMNTLSKFIRVSKHKQYESVASDLVEVAQEYYERLKTKAKRMIGYKGYMAEKEQFVPNDVTVDDSTLNNMRNLFVEQNLDGRVEQALPLLARLQKEKANTASVDMREVEEFESWADQVIESANTFTLSRSATVKLSKLMQQPLPVGIDGLNAIGQLAEIFDLGHLGDQLYRLSLDDTAADARPLVQEYLRVNGVDFKSQEPELTSNNPSSTPQDKQTDKPEPVAEAINVLKKLAAV